MALLGGIAAFFDKYLLGYALGTAAGPSLEPFVQRLANAAWEQNQDKPLPAELAAMLAAQGERSPGWAHGEGGLTGFNDGRIDSLIELYDEAPDLATLYDLWRRGLIGDGDFGEGARKARIESKWIGGLRALKQRILSPAEAANAWQQGFMSESEASAEAALSGVSPERSDVQRKTAGLPPGAMDSLVLLRRGIIDTATYAQIVREGHTKTKYTDALLALRNQVTAPATAAGLWLRGWITEGEAKQIGALSGYGPEQMEHLYLNRGRPATTRQVHIGYARGGTLPGVAGEQAAMRRAVEESNIRPEWFDLLWASRYTYPSPFVIRGLTEDGTFTRAQAEEILLHSGWRPDLAAAAAAKWAPEAGEAGGGPWANRARGRLFTAAHNEYMDGSIDDSTARSALSLVGARPAEQNTILAIWDNERSFQRRELTVAQILKLYKRSIWSRPQAQAALEGLDLASGDAADLLDSV